MTDTFENFRHLSQPKEETRFHFLQLHNGESVYVAFNLHSPDDLKVQSVHTVNDENKQIMVSCLHDDNDEDSCCPFCAADIKRSYRIFITLLQYTTTGESTPVIWNASAYKVGDTLYDLLTNEGDISKRLFKVTRVDGPTAFSVEYQITPVATTRPLNPDYSVFDNFSLTNIIKEKTPEELCDFISTGSFPHVAKDTIQLSEFEEEESAQPISVEEQSNEALADIFGAENIKHLKEPLNSIDPNSSSSPLPYESSTTSPVTKPANAFFEVDDLPF